MPWFLQIGNIFFSEPGFRVKEMEYKYKIRKTSYLKTTFIKKKNLYLSHLTEMNRDSNLQLNKCRTKLSYLTRTN